MPFQNRVDPFSALHAVPGRGLFTGNRGILHDPETRTIKHQRWATEGWVICTLAPLPRRVPRESVMTGRRWTELFFLDEAVGLAAGHRPCHACRREAAIAFRDSVGVERLSTLSTMITAEMKRYIRARSPEARSPCEPRDLPDGAFFATGDKAFLKWRDAAHRFSFAGYGPAQRLPDSALRLTPQTSCKALLEGYRPVLHSTLAAS